MLSKSSLLIVSHLSRHSSNLGKCAKHINQGDVGSNFNIHSQQILMPDSAQRFQVVELFLIAAPY